MVKVALGSYRTPTMEGDQQYPPTEKFYRNRQPPLPWHRRSFEDPGHE